MMKPVATFLSLFLALNPSLAKTNAATQVSESPKRSVLKIQTRTKSVLARVVQRTRRPLVTNNITDGDDGPPGSDELDLHRSYRRPELVIDRDQDISDHAKTRLLIARARALQKYRETWG